MQDSRRLSRRIRNDMSRIMVAARCCGFFFNDTATTEIYTLSLHDALPIYVDSKHAAALDVAAGPRINSIVVDTDKTAADMIQYLKRNKLGFATFLPMNKMKDRGVPDEVKVLKSEEGVVGLALDLVSYDPQFRTVFGYVFGDIVASDRMPYFSPYFSVFCACLCPENAQVYVLVDAKIIYLSIERRKHETSFKGCCRQSIEGVSQTKDSYSRGGC